jgi:DNA-binding transcriptional MerR regulator
MRTVGELSRLTGVTVRTLHHYDEIGLLSPGGRSEAGYRLYGYEDLTRLQEILVWRQLGFSLEEIQRLVDDPGHDRIQALRRQRELVEHELERMRATAHALDVALTAHETGVPMKDGEMFEGFDPSDYEQEVRERWGHTEPYRESAQRTARYGDREWADIRSEADQIVRDFAALLAAGEPADDQQARAVAERHRSHLSRWFFAVSAQMHRNMAEMYIGDPRFGASYDRFADGLAAYVHDAILANADDQEAVSR